MTDNNNNSNAPIEGAGGSSAAAGTDNAAPVAFSNVQIEVNGKQYFSNPPQNVDENWEYTSEVLFGNGESDIAKPILTKTDLITGYAGYAGFDLARMQERNGFIYGSVPLRLGLVFMGQNSVRSFAQLCALYGITFPPPSITVDIYVVVEKSQRVQFNISKSDVDDFAQRLGASLQQVSQARLAGSAIGTLLSR